MKKFLMILTGALVLTLAACGGGDDTPADDSTSSGDADTGVTIDGAYDAQAAEADYKAKCLSCHGGDLQGGYGPGLAGGAYTYDEILSAIENGAGGGSMPAGLVEGEAAENLSAWIADQ